MIPVLIEKVPGKKTESFAVKTSRSVFFLGVTVVLVVSSMLPAVAQRIEQRNTAPTALQSSAPALPNFWDPRSRPEKPAGDLGNIRFLTSGDFPPFNFLDSSGRLTGFNVDLARAICEELKATCTIQMRPFEDLVSALTDRRGDAVIAGLAYPPELRAKVDISSVYLTAPGRFIAPNGTSLIATPEGLAGRWISVVSGSAHEAFMLDHFDGARLVAYPNEASARNALRDGTVDVHFGDAIGLAFWLAGEASHRCCRFLGDPYLESAYFGDGFRIAVAKGNRKLRQALDYALPRLAESGMLSELYLRYFPIGYY
jgi:polar amino acid transport system substrate-binding protein